MDQQEKIDKLVEELIANPIETTAGDVPVDVDSRCWQIFEMALWRKNMSVMMPRFSMASYKFPEYIVVSDK